MRSVSPSFVIWGVFTLLGIVCAGLSFTRLYRSAWIAFGGLPSLCIGILYSVFILIANDQLCEVWVWVPLLILVGNILIGALSSVRYIATAGNTRRFQITKSSFRSLAVFAAVSTAWVLLSALTWLGGKPAVTRFISASMDREREAMLKWEQRNYPDEWNRHRTLPWQPRIVFFRSVALAPGLFLCRYDLLDNAPLCQCGNWGLFFWTGDSTRQLAGRWVWIE